jgi:riboflavin kinase/FMN adenylyltransferase
VSFEHRLRGMVTFDSVDALLRQMRLDVDRTRELLA